MVEALYFYSTKHNNNTMNAYEREKLIKTTLVVGSKIYSTKSQREVGVTRISDSNVWVEHNRFSWSSATKLFYRGIWVSSELYLVGPKHLRA